jgi:hypothetical protein
VCSSDLNPTSKPPHFLFSSSQLISQSCVHVTLWSSEYEQQEEGTNDHYTVRSFERVFTSRNESKNKQNEHEVHPKTGHEDPEGE